MPVDAQRLGGVLDQSRPQVQPVGDQRFHETHRRPPERACSELTGRDGQIGQDGDLLVRQVVDDRQASSPSVAGRTPARLVSDPTESITWTQPRPPPVRRRGGAVGCFLPRARAAIRSVTRRCDAGVRTVSRAPNATRAGSTVVRRRRPGLVTETDAHHVMRHQRPFRAAGIRC